MKNRSLLDIVILIFTVTVSFGIVALGALVAIIKIRSPSQDTTELTDVLQAIIIFLIGSLFGLLAGKGMKE